MLKISFSIALLVLCFMPATVSQPSRSSSNNQRGQTKAKPSPSPLNNGQTELDKAIEAERKRYEEERGRKENMYKEAQFQQNGVIATAAAYNVIVAGVYVLVAFFTLLAIRRQAKKAGEQVAKMQDTLEAIQNQGKTLHTQAIANLSQARSTREALIATKKAAADQLLALQGQWKAMDEALEEQRRMVAQNERAVKAAEDNVNAVKEAFYTGERAYMGIMALEIGDLVQDEVVTLAILWQNGGKTPAWNFRCLPSLVLSEDEPKGEMYFADDDFSDISGSFWPAQTMRQIQYPEASLKITKELMGELWRGQERRLWATVRAVYRDISGEVQFFYNAALFMVDPLAAPTKGHFVETFQYVDFVSKRQKAEAEKQNPN